MDTTETSETETHETPKKPGLKKTKAATRLKPKYEVPQSLDEAAKLITVMSEKRARIATINQDADARIAKINEMADAKQAPLLAELELLFSCVKSFAEARRNELTEGGTVKTVKTSAGIMLWRDNPPSVEIEDEQKVLDHLETAAELGKFIRRPDPEINRQALLENQEEANEIPGVRIVQGEEFRVKPKGDKSELAQATIGKLLRSKAPKKREPQKKSA